MKLTVTVLNHMEGPSARVLKHCNNLLGGGVSMGTFSHVVLAGLTRTGIFPKPRRWIAHVSFLYLV